MIETPCKNICKINEKSGLCYGCLRTQQEINIWIRLKDTEKKEIVSSLKNRFQILKKLNKKF